MPLSTLRLYKVCLLLISSSILANVNAQAFNIADSRYYVSSQSKRVFIPYKANLSIQQSSKKIERLLISIHSSSYDANQYFNNAVQATKKQGLYQNTLIIAPQFLYQKQLPTTRISNQMLYWRVAPFRGSSKGAYGQDDNKLNSNRISINAFTILDSLLAKVTLKNRFPNLKEIVIVGHSAGGQLVQRYAMVGKFTPSRSINMRYVVSAPSSYAYPTHKRINASQNLVTPSLSNCKKYNNWGYGLEKPYRYFKHMSSDFIRSRYAKRHVFYLVGSHDNNPKDKSLGKSCSAMLQGNNRLQRMQHFSKMLNHYYGKGIRRNHIFYMVNGVGHHGKSNMLSKQGLSAMFGRLK